MNSEIASASRADTQPAGNRPRAFARTGSKMTAAMLACLAISAPVCPEPTQESLWFRNAQITVQATRMLDVLHTAEVYGLRSKDYTLAMLPEELDTVLANRADATVRKRFEATLSRAATRFIADLHHGRIDAQGAGFDLPAPPARFDAARQLRKLAASRDLPAALAALEPAAPPYQRLKTALTEYRSLARQPGLTALPALPARSIFADDEYPGAPQLRRLLAAVGDLPEDAVMRQNDTTAIDSELVAAIERFQRRHGITVDGVVGPRTFAALTTPFSQRITQIELAMERWRWLSAVERPSIVVNIPQFMLFAVAHDATPGAETLEMRVIVGKNYPHMRTPVFSSRITEVVFQPYWNVPRRILLEEFLPRIRANPALLDRFHMEIVSGATDDARIVAPSTAAFEGLATGTLRLRQRPGAGNALGAVKFGMPNRYSVYLHSTPEQALFERSARTFSHGCIRVSEPAALAEYVLRANHGWDRSAIEAALNGTRTKYIRLDRSVPVVIFYATAVVARTAGVLFFDDVYGHDARLQQLLEQASR